MGHVCVALVKIRWHVSTSPNPPKSGECKPLKPWMIHHRQNYDLDRGAGVASKMVGLGLSQLSGCENGPVQVKRIQRLIYEEFQCPIRLV